MPKLSVVVPVYGVEKYIERCARSLFEQTLDDIEFIFLDDCSPDKSMDILGQIIEEYRPSLAEKKHVVRIERMQMNSGQAAVRKHGIQLCTGDYVIHCDSDDWVDVNMYKILYDKAIEGNYDMVRCNFARTDGYNVSICIQLPSDCYENPERLISYALIGFDLTSTCDKVFKRTLYHSDIQFPKYNMQEDAALVIQLLCRCKRCAFVSQIGYYYYINPNSISHTLTTEAFLNRLNQVANNANIIFDSLEYFGYSRRLSREIIAHKLNVRNHILNILGESKYFNLWLNTYPEINHKVILNSKIKRSAKLYYILAKLRVISIILKLKSKLKK